MESSTTATNRPTPPRSKRSAVPPKAHSLATNRLIQERKNWRKKHPHGFYARPIRLANGTRNLLLWECGIPGKHDTIWAGAVYPVKMSFPANYPSKPPKCQFPPGFFHPNIYPSGKVCLSILSDDGWKPSMTIKQILLGIQELLDTPNPKSPAQAPAINLFRNDKQAYREQILDQAKKYVVG